MSKRKFEDFKDDSQFKFWGIVISRFVWNYSRSQVAKTFACTEPYVTQVMNKFEDDGGYIDHRQFNRGSNLKLKLSVQKTIVRNIKKKPNSSSTQLVKKVSDRGHDEISDRYIRNLRNDLGFNAIKSSLLPNLSEDNLQARLEYCERHLEDKFSNAVFTDESNFQLAATNQVLWYRKDEDVKPHMTKPRNNRKIMIWGGISRKGQTPLHIIRLDEGEKVTSEVYVDCLENNLIESMNKKHGEKKWRLLQDNARPHVAENTLNYFNERNIKTMSHPPYSPDLNPIEKVWAWMKADIGQTTHLNIEHLIKAIVKKWNSMTLEYQNSLIDRHMRVIKQVYDAGGTYV
jgi:transposase